jgi:hypothetical protein
VFTFVRLVEVGIEDFLLGRAIKRIRHYCLERVGDTARFMLSGNNDAAGVMANMGMTSSPWQLYFTAAIAVAVVDAVIGGAALAVGVAFGTSLAVAVVIGTAADDQLPATSSRPRPSCRVAPCRALQLGTLPCEWRERRRLSQFDLGSVSKRHPSVVETTPHARARRSSSSWRPR